MASNPEGPFTPEDGKKLGVALVIGAAAGAILPVVSLPMGMIAGGAWFAWKKFGGRR